MKTAPAKFPGHPREPKHAPRLGPASIKLLYTLICMTIRLNSVPNRHGKIRIDMSLSNYAQLYSVSQKQALFFIYEAPTLGCFEVILYCYKTLSSTGGNIDFKLRGLNTTRI